MIQEILQELIEEITVWLQAAGVDNPVVQLDRAASPDFGEYSTNVAMRYAKQLDKKPFELAEELAAFLHNKQINSLSKVEAMNPGFVNLHLAAVVKVRHLESILGAEDSFGSNQALKGEKWVIEHTSPNPNKAMHLGHLRNNLVGMGIVRLLKMSGADVTSDAVYNNRGIAIAKVMYGYLAHMKKDDSTPTDIDYWVEHKTEWFTPIEKEMKPDVFVTECYILGEQDNTANQDVEKEIRQMVVDWETGNQAVLNLWEVVLEFAYEGIDRTLNRLGNSWDKIWYEHEHYQQGKKYVETGLEKEVFQTLDDGAILTNLESDYDLSDTVLLKNDGTSLYITQDLALTDLKKKTYNADKLVWVIGPDQSLALKQLFAVCEQLGIGNRDDFTHVAYGYVGLKDEDGGFKKMSSRAGTVVLIDDVIDEVKASIRERFDEDERHDESTREALSEKLAIAAVKFSFLRSDRNQDLSFDIKQSVDVHGDSGMYVMYSFVRTQSILRKGSGSSTVVSVPSELGEEASLVRSMVYFDEVVKKSTDDLSVHHVAQYLLEVSSLFNSWYAKETILDGGEQEGYKLAIVKAAGIVLKNGMAILGIDTVDEI
ncbi:MAG: arginine--tRNA ligase [Candidatus Pacebacteria bacterium]|nr:arginine--tRNA ligase [Candidatus Paceibacterota bacterium]